MTLFKAGAVFTSTVPPTQMNPHARGNSIAATTNNSFGVEAKNSTDSVLPEALSHLM